MRKWWDQIKNKQKGIGVVEIILILVILIAIVIFFRNEISALVSKLLGQITEGGNTIMNSTVTPQAP